MSPYEEHTKLKKRQRESLRSVEQLAWDSPQPSWKQVHAWLTNGRMKLEPNFIAECKRVFKVAKKWAGKNTVVPIQEFKSTKPS